MTNAAHYGARAYAVIAFIECLVSGWDFFTLFYLFWFCYFFLDCNVELKKSFFICGDLKGGIRSDVSYNLFNGNIDS